MTPWLHSTKLHVLDVRQEPAGTVYTILLVPLDQYVPEQLKRTALWYWANLIT